MTRSPRSGPTAAVLNRVRPPDDTEHKDRTMQQPEPGRQDSAAEAGAQYVDEIMAGPGGVMTDDVGVITGDLTVRTRLGDDGHAHVTVQYTGADEWYTLTGSPAPVPDGHLAAYHQHLLDRIRHGHAAEAT